MSWAASLPVGPNFLQKIVFLKKPLVPGSFAAWGRTCSQKRTCFEQATYPGQLRCLGRNLCSKTDVFVEQATCPWQLRCLGQNLFSKNGFQELWNSCAQKQDVGNLKERTFRNSGTPVRRKERRKYQQLHFREFWDSCAQNKTSAISANALSGILGLLCAEQNVGNLKTWQRLRPYRCGRSRRFPHIGKGWGFCSVSRNELG